MTKSLVFLLLPLLLIFPSSTLIAQTPAPLEKQLNNLLKESKKTKPSCEQYTRQLKKAGDKVGFIPFLPYGRLNHPEKIPELIQQLSQNSGTPLATQEAEKLLDNHFDEIDPALFKKISLELQYFCDSLDFFTDTRNLLRYYKINPTKNPDQTKLLSLAFNFLNKESSFPTTILSTTLQISLLKDLSDNGFIQSPKIKKQISALDKDFMAYRKIMETKLKKFDNVDYKKIHLFEMQEAKRFAKKIQQTLKSLPPL